MANQVGLDIVISDDNINRVTVFHDSSSDKHVASTTIIPNRKYFKVSGYSSSTFAFSASFRPIK